MKRFSLYIESTEYDENIEGKVGSRYYEIIHTGEEGLHKFEIRHSVSNVRGKKRIETDFDVDGSSDKIGDIDSHNSRKILLGVRRSIRDVIDREQPDRISFYGNSKRKHKIYGSFANNISRQYGGYHTFDEKSHHITFNKGNKL